MKKTQILTRVLLCKRKRNCFCKAKQSIPTIINEFVEMTIFLCLRCFYIYDKMQGCIDESVFKNSVEIALFRSVSKINRFLRFTQKFKMAAKSGRKPIFAKSPQ